MRGKLSNTDVLMFLQQLRVLLAAGDSADRALQRIQRHNPAPRLRRHLETAVQKLKTGASLAQALFQPGHPFPDSMARRLESVPDETGQLEAALANLETAYRLRGRYRLEFGGWLSEDRFFFLFFSILSLGLVYGVPAVFLDFARMTGMQDSAPNLPFPTMVTLWVSRILETAWPVAWALMVVLVYYLIFWGTRLNRYASDLVYLFSLLKARLESGADLKQTLTELEHSMDPRPLRQTVQALLNGVENGKPFSAAVRDTGVFPPLVPDMLEYGEMNGDLAAPVQEIVDHYTVFARRGIHYNQKGLVVLLVLFVLIVLWVVLSAYAPLFGMGLMF